MILLQIYQGAERMKEIDPHGLTLSVVAVVVVFSALLILYLLYSLSGGIFTGKFRRKPRTKPADADTAAAIALALHLHVSQDCPDDEAAAIAAALHMYLSDGVHDTEPGIITIRRELPSSWGDKSKLFRKKPQAK